MHGLDQKAQVCFAYLADLKEEGEPFFSNLFDSAWFTRGWT